ncbi:MAG: DUF4105 domain-containing protein [Muribaculaceae bacterium]|nr:DUF4105 domain-containing protein [Muribaculaceae bacterium]
MRRNSETKRMSRALTLLVWLVLGSAAALAQADTVRVRLVTFYPGSEIYSVYGHTELRVTQGQADYYFNYGVFDFNTPGFVYRFVTGEADYMCVAVPPQYAMMEPGRRMVEQELNLTQEQARQVRDYLVENSMPGQNTYRYQYLSDNCSTRPRDIIEQAIGQPLHNPAITTNITYRDMMKQCASNYAWLQFGIDLVLGADLDRVISEHEQMFIPMVLMKAAEGTTLERNGQLVPLVNATEVIVDGSEDGIVMPPTPWWLSPMTVALLLLAVAVIISVRDLRRRRITRWFDTVVYALYGMAGCVLFFLIFVSVREATSPNYNAFWAHPFCLILAVLPWIKRANRCLRWCHVANAVVVALLLIALPWIPQVVNAAFFPLLAVTLMRSLTNVAILSR